MPCFNAARYVRAAVDSVLGQTWREVELIVVDDGSTDGSLEALRAISDPRLRVIAQANRGQCAASNRGYREATGGLIKFFDADDVMAPEMIALQVARLAGRTDAIAMGEWKRFHGDAPDQEPFPRLPMYRDCPPAEWLVQEWANARPMMQCGLWLIPRSIIDAHGLWDERLSLINDFEYFSRLLLGASEILYTPGARMHYRSGLAGSLSSRKSRAAVESALLSLLLGTQHLLKVCDTPEARASCATLLQDFEFTYYPEHPDLRARARARVAELGGSKLEPDGPPGFQKLRRLVGWRLARRAQRYAEAIGLNRAARKIS
ncbi:glycosyltransferase involved in cell wall biosynthesis [Rhodoblastus acidophilus]|uniref:glycosyltransferase family 2 protein n=1 Tax=Rhodoblastus acidophilus TaxID=1074 RepID=UPI0031451B31|nr:glycosyltransferase involved in cell wall biosynthesis [Rhodoblastus acidophilus]MCW2333226.1 glycosyltransferase involved in cell wall biosynthesis [Rhodoblastus acidophilus]